MQTPSILQRAKQAAPAFQKHDISQFIPPEVSDIVDRVVAAAMKVLYSKDMQEDVLKELQRDVPAGQKMAEAVTGLVLMLDQRSNGLPMAAIFPVAMKLLDEAAEILSAAGQTVTQEDYNDAARRMFALIGQKMGATKDQVMQGARAALSGDAESAEPVPDDEQAEMQGMPQQMPQQMPQGGMQ